MNESDSQETPQPTTPRVGVARRLWRGTLWLLGSLLLLPVVALGLLQLDGVQQRLTREIETALGGEQAGIQVRGLGGVLPFDLRLGSLKLADANGAWLEAEGVVVSWPLAALLKGRVRFGEISATRIALLRPPLDATPEPTPEEPFDPAVLTETLNQVAWLPPLQVDRLRVGRFELGAAVLGQAALFSLDGRLRPEGGAPLAWALTLTRKDRPGADLQVTGSVQPGNGTVSLDVTGAEESGLAAAFLGGAVDDRLSFTLKGTGTVAGWSGNLALSWPAWGRVETRLTLEPARLTARLHQGRWQPPAGLLPGEIAALFQADGVPFAAHVAADPDAGRLELTAVELAGERLTVTGTARLELDEGRLQARLQGRLDDAAPLSGLAGQPLSGPVSVTVGAEGKMAAPSLQLTLSSPGLTVAGNHLHTVDLTLGAQLPEPLERLPEGLVFTAAGSVAEVRLADADAALPPLRPRVELQGQIEAGNRLELTLWRVENGDSTRLSGQGRVDLESLDGAFDIQGGADRLAEWLAPLEVPVTGVVGLDGVLRLSEGLTRAGFQGVVSGRDLAGLPPAAATLAGTAPRMTLEAGWQAERGVAVTSAVLAGEGIEVRASGGLEGEALAGEVTAELPDLGRLSALTGQSLGGAGHLHARIGGSLAAPKVEVRVTSAAVTVDGITWLQPALTLSAEDLPGEAVGHVELTARQAGGQLALSSPFRFRERRHLHLDGLRLRAPKSHLAGDLLLDVEAGSASGRLKGGSSDLSALKGWTGEPLAGRAELSVTLENSDDGVARGTMNLAASGLEGTFGRVGKLTVRAHAGLRDGQPVVDARLELQRLQQPGGETLESLKASLKGSQKRADFSVDGLGTAQWPFTVRARGRVGQRAEGFDLELNHLDGQVGGEPLTLARTLKVTWKGEDFDAGPWDVGLGGMRLRGSARNRGGRVAVSMNGQGDLALLHRLGIHPLQGDARFELTLDGAAAAPNLTGHAALNRVRILAADLEGVPPADLTLDLVMADGRGLEVRLTATGLSKGVMTGRAAVPMRLVLAPFAVAMPEGEALVAALKADLDLANVALWGGLEDEQRLDGLLRIDLELAGSLEAPQLNGTVRVEDGVFEQADAGIHFQDVRLLARGEGNALVLESLSGRDGGDGQLSGSGRVSLDGAALHPIDLGLKLQNVALIRRDDAFLEISGTIGLRRNEGAFHTDGALTVNRGEFALAEMGGPDIDVIELESAEEGAETADAGGQAGFVSSLDLKVDVPGRVFVRGRGLESEWQGGFQLGGTTLAPLMVGQLQVKRGQLDFLEHRFQLRTGIIRFEGASPPAPVLNLEAAAQGRSILAIVNLSGTVNAPRLTFSSEPELPQDEVLSQLLFDRTSDTISAAQAIKLAAALETLRSGGPSLMGEVSRGLGIDRLDIAGDSMETGSLNVGKYVTDTLYMEVEKGLKDNTGRISIEKELSQEFTLGVGVDTGSNADLGILWERHY